MTMSVLFIVSMPVCCVCNDNVCVCLLESAIASTYPGIGSPHNYQSVTGGV